MPSILSLTLYTTKSFDYIIESKKEKKKLKLVRNKEYYKVFREHVGTGLKVPEYGIKQEKTEQQKN